MTDLEINKKIAFLNGYIPKSGAVSHDSETIIWTRRQKDGEVITVIPDYCSDLNAMHKICEALDVQEKINFVYHLNDLGYYSEYDLVFAPAKDRAIAYLKTKYSYK